MAADRASATCFRPFVHFLRVLCGHIWDPGMGEAHGGVAIVFGSGGLGGSWPGLVLGSV